MSRHKFGNEAGRLTQWIPAGEIDVDPAVQRALNARWAEHIGRELDPDLIGVMHVSQRESGRKVVIDGQHRLHGVKNYFGNNGTLVECKVYHGLTRAQEAALFVGLNNFRRPQRIDVFQKNVQAKDPTTVAINAIVQHVGFRVDRAKAPKTISAVAALEDVYFAFADRHHDPARKPTPPPSTPATPEERKPRVFTPNPVLLTDTLTVIREAWGGVADSLNGHLIVGVGRVIAARQRAMDLADFAHRLSSYAGGPSALLGTARGRKGLVGGTIGAAVADTCVDLYNKGRRVGKLDPLRDQSAAA